jgi:hypothetical protein
MIDEIDHTLLNFRLDVCPGLVVRWRPSNRYEACAMDRTVESGQPVPTALLASASPAGAAIVDPTVDEAGSRVGSGPTYSYWAECECPGDCLRDHANE